MSAPESRSRLSARPSLEQLHKQAKDLLQSARAGDSAALARLASVAAPRGTAEPKLADAQFTIAGASRPIAHWRRQRARCGADRDAAGARWATPLAWAQKRGTTRS
jgi:hypothetical protein